MPRSLTALLLLALVALGGLVVLVFSTDADDPAPQGSLDHATDDSRESDETDDSADGPAESVVVTDPGVDAPLVPRVLPPDAAIEDVRDALFAGDAEALTEADARIGRLASLSIASLRSLQRQITMTDDPRVRGVALAALGALGSEASLRFLCGRLRVDAAPEEIIGALLGLFRDRRDDADDASLVEVAALSLGDLRVEVDTLPSDAYVRDAFRRFLDRAETVETTGSEVAALLIGTIARSPSLAELLADGERLRPYVAALKPTVLALLKTVVLQQQGLSASTRRAFENA
jgi:hypothetical protein